MRQQQRQLDVALGREHRHQDCRTETPIRRAARATPRAGGRTSGRCGPRRSAPSPARRAIQPADQIQQRRFARAGRPHQREEFAFRHFEIQPGQHVNLFRAAVKTSHVFDLNQNSVVVLIVFFCYPRAIGQDPPQARPQSFRRRSSPRRSSTSSPRVAATVIARRSTRPSRTTQTTCFPSCSRTAAFGMRDAAWCRSRVAVLRRRLERHLHAHVRQECAGRASRSPRALSPSPSAGPPSG